MSTTLADLLKPALRRAGITQLPGITPSVDQYGELIPEVNRMLSSWNCDGHKIYTTSIDRYAMIPQQTTYFLGPNGDWINPRPTFIYRANVVIMSTSPEIHRPIHLLTDAEWAAKSITELPMAWPYEMYNDGASPDVKLYFYGFPTQPNDIELFTWQDLKTDFSDVTDAVTLPTGYEDAIVTNLALRCISLYPYDSKLSVAQLSKLERDAARAVRAIQILNTECIPLVSEAADLGSSSGRAARTRPDVRTGNYI